jgi:hypothetical protein
MQNEASIDLISRCRCGQCELKISRVRMESEPSNSFDCHCTKCRKYSGSAFTSYLRVADDQIDLLKQSTIKYYVDACDEIGPKIERIFCSQCKCKLATRSQDAPLSTWYLNMGSIADESIQADFSSQWRNSRVSKQSQQTAAWYPAFPRYEENNIPQRQFLGSCACGNAKFCITDWVVPNVLEHCYCRLCRQMSGSAFVSWPLVDPQNFQWLTKEPPLLRTTDVGQRHVCDICGVCMTIDYTGKGNNDITFQASAGSIDDFPNMDWCWEDVKHIYCQDNAAWYELPEDGLPQYFDE